MLKVWVNGVQKLRYNLTNADTHSYTVGKDYDAQRLCCNVSIGTDS